MNLPSPDFAWNKFVQTIEVLQNKKEKMIWNKDDKVWKYVLFLRCFETIL